MKTLIEDKSKRIFRDGCDYRYKGRTELKRQSGGERFYVMYETPAGEASRAAQLSDGEADEVAR